MALKRTPFKRKPPKLKRSNIRKTPRSETKAKEQRNLQKGINFAHLQEKLDPREVDADYLKWIRKQPCIFTKRTHEQAQTPQQHIDASHCIKSVGAWGSDYDALPVINYLHIGEQHGKDASQVEAKHNKNYLEEIKKHNAKYEADTGRKISRQKTRG